MAHRRRLGRKLFKFFLPIALVVAGAIGFVMVWIVYGVTRPPRRSYLVTPQAFKEFSGSGPVLRATDETWSNHDGTRARGWLLRGAEGGPAMIILHRYGADRSWLFNLGVKIHEQANFTVLWPDLRGHGLNPLVSWTSFGAREGDDVLAALDFLRTIKTNNRRLLVGDQIGLYGVELGAYAALRAASREKSVHALVLDSVPRSPDELLQAAVSNDLGVDNRFLQYLARAGTHIYLLGHYHNTPSCEMAASVRDQRVLLLGGEDAGYLRASTAALARCFPSPTKLEVNTELQLTGLSLPFATGEQGEGYDRRVIEFFDRMLR